MVKKPSANRPVDVAEAQQRLPALLDDLAREHGRVIIERDGVPVGAIISPRDLERLQLLDEQREQDFRAIHEFSKAFSGVPLDELEREVTKAISEVREENRRGAKQRPLRRA